MKKILDKGKTIRGITIVALVITIIVLLILAGVTIAILTGQNGILGNTEKAIEKSENGQIEENAVLTDYENEIGKYFVISDRTTEGQIPSNITIPETKIIKTGTVVTSTAAYDVDTTLNSYTVDKSGMYYIKADFGWGNISSTTGYICLYLKVNNTSVTWDQRNSVQFNYLGLSAGTVHFLNAGDVVKSTMIQKGPSTVTATGGYNRLLLTPIYYVEEGE